MMIITVKMMRMMVVMVMMVYRTLIVRGRRGERNKLRGRRVQLKGQMRWHWCHQYEMKEEKMKM